MTYYYACVVKPVLNTHPTLKSAYVWISVSGWTGGEEHEWGL